MSDRVAAVLVDPTTGLPYTAIPVNIGSTVNRTASGNITSTQGVALSTAACGSAAFQVAGTWTGTLVFEYTLDDLSWVSLSVTPDGGGPAVSSTTANGNWSVQVESYSQVRVRGNTVGSGTAAVFLSASTATSVVTIAGPIPTGDNTIGRVKVTDGTNVAAVSSGSALSVDASTTTALPLPSGAATAAAQATGNASLSSIDTKTPVLSGGRVPVDGSGATQPVSGTVTANAGTGTFAVSAASLPLPSGAATATKQPALGVAGTASADVLTVQGIAGAVAVKTDGSATTQPVSIAGTVAVSAASLPLPSGAATATLQTSGNASLSSIDGKTPALGQALMAASVPVAIASNQTALSVSGTVTANAGSGTFAVSNANLDVALSTLSLKNQFPTTLGITTKASSLSVALASDQVGTAGAGSTTVLTVQGNASGTAIPVSGAVTVTGVATETSLAKLTVAQGAALGTNTLALTGGSVTTSPPTVSTGTIQPLNLNLANALRVDASNNTVTTTGSGTAGTPAAGVSSIQGVSGMTAVQVSGTASAGAAPTTPPVYAAGLDSAGNVRPLALDTTGRPAGSSKTFITTNVTTQLIKSGAGVLRGIIINPGITSAFLLYDSAGAASGQFSGAGTTAPAYLYEVQYGPNGVAFTNGLVITTSGGTPAQLLVIYD